jgi:hypothetical protein
MIFADKVDPKNQLCGRAHQNLVTPLEDPDTWTARMVRWRPRASKRSVDRPQEKWYDDIKRVAGLKWLQRTQGK